jgi:hypothetical protein
MVVACNIPIVKSQPAGLMPQLEDQVLRFDAACSCGERMHGDPYSKFVQIYSNPAATMHEIII